MINAMLNALALLGMAFAILAGTIFIFAGIVGVGHAIFG